MTLKAKVTREKVVKLDFIKVENFCFKGHFYENEKMILQNGRKYLQITYLTSKLFLE